jgi:hypothetical protein
MPQEYVHLMRLPIVDAFRQRTAVVAQPFARLVDVTQEIILAALAKQFFGRIAGQPMRAFVPILNPAISIHEIHAIANMIEQIFIEGRIGGTRLFFLVFRLDEMPPNCTYYPIKCESFAHTQSILEGTAVPFSPIYLLN